MKRAMIAAERIKVLDLMAHKLLVVDDEEAILFAMKEYFNIRGLNVDVAHDSEEAMAMMKSGHYDAAIVDLRLSGFSGTEGLDVVRFAAEHSPATRIIILTAYGTPQLEQQALDMGVYSFLRKPKPLPDIAQIVFGLLSEPPPANENGNIKS